MPISASVFCLATAIFFEARDQPLRGQEMIAEVVINRTESNRFPDDICSVVFEPSAFSFTHDGASDNPEDYTTKKDQEAYVDALTIAQEYLLEDKEVVITSTHYHTTSVSPYWADLWSVDVVFHDHVFYTCEGFC